MRKFKGNETSKEVKNQSQINQIRLTTSKMDNTKKYTLSTTKRMVEDINDIMMKVTLY